MNWHRLSPEHARLIALQNAFVLGARYGAGRVITGAEAMREAEKQFPLTMLQPRVVTLHEGSQYKIDLFLGVVLAKLAPRGERFTPAGVTVAALNGYKRLLDAWEPGIEVRRAIPDAPRTGISEDGKLFRVTPVLPVGMWIWWTLDDLRLIVSLLDTPTEEVPV